MRESSPHRARKRFGQHFLNDPEIIDRIVNSIAPQPNQTVVEIGPGLSALTEPLTEICPHLTVIEIDRDLAARLRHRYDAARLTVIEADALNVDFTALASTPATLRIVGNLPYNISSPLLFHLRTHAAAVADQHFMLQKEVVARIVATPGTPAYGRLSVMLQQQYQVESLFDVPRIAFDPPPAVESAVLRMIPWRPQPPQGYRPISQACFEAVVARAFSQRRKMLRGVLSVWRDVFDWQSLGIDPCARAENLSPADFVRLADALHLHASQRPA